MRPTTGVGEAWISPSSSSKPPEPRAPPEPIERSFRFAPAQKVLPSLVITSARTDASALAAASASRSACTRAAPNALRLSVSTSVAVITPPDVSTFTGFMGDSDRWTR